MKKFIIAGCIGLVASIVSAQSITAPASEVSVIEKSLNGGTTVAVTNNKPQEVWIPVNLAVDVGGVASGVSTNTISYIPSGSTKTYRLASLVITDGAETLNVLSNYPALAYGDSLVIASDRATTTNSFAVGIVKTVIPR